MSENTKRITIAVRVNVSITVDTVQAPDGTVEVVDVVSVNGLPSAVDVMEALDADGDFAQLDEAFEELTKD